MSVLQTKVRPNFVPPGKAGEVRRVEVVDLIRIGRDTVAACRDLDQVGTYYETITPRPIEVGAVGWLECLPAKNRLPLAWIFFAEWSVELCTSEKPSSKTVEIAGETTWPRSTVIAIESKNPTYSDFSDPENLISRPSSL